MAYCKERKQICIQWVAYCKWWCNNVMEDEWCSKCWGEWKKLHVIALSYLKKDIEIIIYSWLCRHKHIPCGGMNENDTEWLKNCRFKVGKEETRYKDIVCIRQGADIRNLAFHGWRCIWTGGSKPQFDLISDRETWNW